MEQGNSYYFLFIIFKCLTSDAPNVQLTFYQTLCSLLQEEEEPMTKAECIAGVKGHEGVGVIQGQAGVNLL